MFIQMLGPNEIILSLALALILNQFYMNYVTQVSEWILSHKWTVGDLWDMLVEYSTQRLKGETSLGFFTWLLPSLAAPHDRHD